MNMNTNETLNDGVLAEAKTETTVGVTEVAKKPIRGRPLNPNATKMLRLNSEYKAVTQGAPKIGSTVIMVKVHRKVKGSEYVHGETPIIGEPISVEIPKRTKPRATKKPQASISVNVIAPEPVINVSEQIKETEAAETNPLV